MNMYVLQLAAKWVSLLVVSVLSIFSANTNFVNENLSVSNQGFNKSLNVVNTIIPYETQVTYNSKIPSNIRNVKVEGQNGMTYVDETGTTQVLKQVVTEEVEQGTGATGEYNGIMTAYGPDCSTCSGVGNVACRTKEGNTFNLIRDGLYYEDSTHGRVRVLAAAHSEFPCGSIVYVQDSKLGDFMGIVLDTGWGMRNSLEKGIIHFDVAYATEKDPELLKATDMSGKVKYSVQRWGW